MSKLSSERCIYSHYSVHVLGQNWYAKNCYIYSVWNTFFQKSFKTL